MRELLDDLVRIHFSFYLNADRASLDLNDANTELAAISAKYGATIAEVLLLAGFIKNFVDAN
jgi:hypothetical protein